MKKIFNFYNIGLMLVVALTAMFAVNVKAAGTVTWSGSNKVTLERTVENVANPITNTFGYTISASSSNPEGATGAPTSATIAITTSDSVSNNNVVKTSDVNFGSMTFTKPGDYTYTLTETSTSNSAYPVDSTNTYTVTISVRNELNPQSIPTGNFTASFVLKDKSGSKVNPSGSNPPKATFKGGVDDSNYGRITVSNTVKGNAADTDEYFPFTITLDETTGTYPITGVDPTITYNGQSITQPTEVTGGTATIYLKHGQTATIGQVGEGQNAFDSIPVGTKYSVSENKKDYDATYSINGGSETSGSSVSNQTLASGNNRIALVNTRNSSPITGIVTNVIPYILIVVAAVCGTLIFTTLKARKQTI